MLSEQELRNRELEVLRREQQLSAREAAGQADTEEAMRRVARLTVEETLVRLGMDGGDPIEMQKDFQQLREWRVAVEGVKQKGILTAVGILITGLAAALWVGVKHLLNQ